MATRNGTPGNDSLTGTQFADSLFGFAGNDSLLGLGGSDTLDGGSGMDTLIGGTGNDLYLVDNTADTVTETAFSGIDTVESSISYTLGENLENLTLMESGAIEGTGNSLNNRIVGNAADNFLAGEEGDDTLYGGNGNDTLYDSASFVSGKNLLYGGDGNDSLVGFGNDTLYGGRGNDTLSGTGSLNGGTGNDTYFINESLGSTITEAANSGIDTVTVSDPQGSYTLSSNLENLILRENNRNSNGIGNSLNNTIVGNNRDNILKGLAGNDNLNGGADNDVLLGSSGGVGERDTLTGGVGRDTFLLGNATGVFYDDRNTASAGRGDYALITDFNNGEDAIKLNGSRADYRIAPSPTGLPTGTAIYLNKPGSEQDELIAIVQGNSGLNLNSSYFKFTDDEFNLSSLNGSNGFKLNGIDADNRSGSSVSGAGDVNGDGFEDIIIGTFSADENYVVFGKAGGFDASLNLSALNGSNGFVINGKDVGDFTLAPVSRAGDVNGDGLSDLIIGDSLANPNGQRSAGSSYVVFGRAGGFGTSLNLSSLNGSNGFVINGIDADDYSGRSVSDVGDVNGDGFDDIIIGASGADPNGSSYNNGQSATGSSYVVFGKAEGFSSSLNLSTLNGSNGFTINSIINQGLGYSVSGTGDINGDGFDDIIIGTLEPVSIDYYNFADKETYVIFGKAGNFDSSINLSALDGSNGFKIIGIEPFDDSGRSVSEVGDINGDGFNDLIIGTNGTESYVIFGKAGNFDASINLSALDGSNGFKINGISDNNYNYSVSGAGDVNGDGFDDLLIGAAGSDPNGENNAGSSYLVFGKAGSFGTSFNLSDINGRNGFVINGIDADDYSGSVSSAGDVNGDGFDDILIGAPGADPNGQLAAGKSYVIFGRDFTGSVTHSGTVGNDPLTGTAGNDILIGGLGNDRLIGGLGIEVLIGGAGNDIISFGATDRRSNGGSGTDTLRIDGADNIDLTTISNNKITEFEIIDITGTGNNSLAFTRLDLLDLSDTTNRLIVNGNAGDKVTSTAQGWAFGGTTTLDSVLYRQYTSGAATLLVDADITQTIT